MLRRGAATLTASNAEDGMATIELDGDDDGSSREAAVGDELVLSLAETPTSGYRWAIETIDPAVLELVGDDYEPPEPGLLGGEGRHLWRARIVGSGTMTLGLVLRRAWDPETAVSSFEVTIDAVG